MKKRITIIIITIAIMLTSLATLSGCHFLERNERRDMRQVVARVMPGTEYEREIFKYELLSAIRQQFQGQNAPSQEAADGVLDTLINRVMQEIRLEQMFNSDELVWRGRWELSGSTSGIEDFFDENQVRRTIFASIDEQLRQVQIEILTNDPNHEFNQTEDPPAAPTPDNPDAVRPVWDEEDDEQFVEDELYFPEFARIPGNVGSNARRALEHAALERFVHDIIGMIRGGFPIYDEERLDAAEADFVSLINNRRFRELYLSLPESYPIQFLVGNQAKMQVKIQILQRHLFEGIVISHQDVGARFRSERDSQMARFTQDTAAYASAVSQNQRIMYRPNSDWFYVRHVLLRFTEEQDARLSAFRARQNVTAEQIEAFRDQLVNELSVYARDDFGFNIPGRQYSAQEVLDIITHEVGLVYGCSVAANRRFEDFIFRFNMDPGGFTHFIGYGIPRDRNAGGAMMREFELGAWELEEHHTVGTVLNRKVITDFGVHIMFYSYNTTSGWVADIGGFVDQNQRQTFRSVFEADLRREQEQRAMQTFERNTIADFRARENNHITFTRTFRDLID